MSVTFENDIYTFACPHCELLVQVQRNEINCRIFRHGVFISNQIPIPPHATQAQCHAFAVSPDVVGCCRPFSFDGKSAIALEVYN